MSLDIYMVMFANVGVLLGDKELHTSGKVPAATYALFTSSCTSSFYR